MRASTRLAPPLVATAVFAACLLFGTGMRAGVRWVSERPVAAQAALLVSIRSGRRGMRIANLTGASYPSCVVTLEGGASSAPFSFPADGSTRLGYGAFRAGSTPLSETDADFSHAFHQTSMMCRDVGGRWISATFR